MKHLSSIQSSKGLGIGSVNGSNNGISSTYLGERSIQLNTQTGIGSGYNVGGAYDNYCGALLWSTVSSGGYPDASLCVALATGWGTYNVANPAMLLNPNYLQISGTLVAQGGANAPRIVMTGGGYLGMWDDGTSYGLMNDDGNPIALYNADNGQFYLSPLITVDYYGSLTYLSGGLQVSGSVTAANLKSLSAFGAKSGSVGTLGGSGATVYYRTITVDGVTVQVLCFT